MNGVEVDANVGALVVTDEVNGPKEKALVFVFGICGTCDVCEPKPNDCPLVCPPNSEELNIGFVCDD